MIDGIEPLGVIWMSCALADVAPQSAIEARVAAISVFFTMVPLSKCAERARTGQGPRLMQRRYPSGAPVLVSSDVGRIAASHHLGRLLKTSAATGPAENALGQPA